MQNKQKIKRYKKWKRNSYHIKKNNYHKYNRDYNVLLTLIHKLQKYDYHKKNKEAIKNDFICFKNKNIQYNRVLQNMNLFRHYNGNLLKLLNYDICGAFYLKNVALVIWMCHNSNNYNILL